MFKNSSITGNSDLIVIKRVVKRIKDDNIRD